MHIHVHAHEKENRSGQNVLRAKEHLNEEIRQHIHRNDCQTRHPEVHLLQQPEGIHLLLTRLLQRNLVAQRRDQRRRKALHQRLDVGNNHRIVVEKTHLNGADEHGNNQVIRGAIDVACQPLQNHVLQTGGNLLQQLPIDLCLLQIRIPLRACHMHKQIGDIRFRKIDEQIE